MLHVDILVLNWISRITQGGAKLSLIFTKKIFPTDILL